MLQREKSVFVIVTKESEVSKATMTSQRPKDSLWHVLQTPPARLIDRSDSLHFRRSTLDLDCFRQSAPHPTPTYTPTTLLCIPSPGATDGRGGVSGKVMV